MRLFSKAKAAPSPQEALGKLKETLELLEKRENFLQKKVEKEISFARSNAKKNRKAALIAIKRKKIYENQIDKLQGARMTIETQVLTIEGAHVSLEAMSAMRQGANALKAIHRNMSVDDVDVVMDDIREQMDVAAEINEAIASPLGDTFDEDELEKELEELEELDQEVKVEEEPEVPLVLPGVPSTAPTPEMTSEEAELAALEAEMAL